TAVIPIGVAAVTGIFLLSSSLEQSLQSKRFSRRRLCTPSIRKCPQVFHGCTVVVSWLPSSRQQPSSRNGQNSSGTRPIRMGQRCTTIFFRSRSSIGWALFIVGVG